MFSSMMDGNNLSSTRERIMIKKGEHFQIYVFISNSAVGNKNKTLLNMNISSSDSL